MNDSKKQGATTNKEKMRVLIESQVTDKVKNIFKENELEMDRQLLKKQDEAKEDDGVVQFKTKVYETVQNKTFQLLATRLRNCRNLSVEQRNVYSKSFEDLHIVFVNMQNDKQKIKIKINKYVQGLCKATFSSFELLHDDFIRLEQAGCCGVGAVLRGFQEKYRDFEFKIFIWRTLPELDNQNVEYQVIKPNFNEQDFRKFVSQLINQTYPDQVGDTQIVEKEVIKYIEKPKIEYVDRVTIKEVPFAVEKIIEKTQIHTVEIKVPEIREVIREVIRTVSLPDKIREAHEMLYGIGKPQNVTEALTIYYEEAEVNNNILAFNSIGQIFFEGKFFPKDLNKSFQYYQRSATANDPEGLYKVGYFLYKGIIDGFTLSQGRIENRDKELEEAIMYLQKASETGHLEALTDLGEIFEHGVLSEVDQDRVIISPELDQAEFYYTQGKKVRYPRAICLLGLFYLNNPQYKQTIIGDNARKAIKYFELARELGYTRAYYYLAQCYENGQGVITPNKETAKAYYKDGALRNDTDCKLNYMFYVMRDASNAGKDEDYQFAYNYFRDVLVTDPQISETYFYLGHLYECGFGVVKDAKVSMSYYNKGSKLGNPACMNKLGDFYHSGYGVPKNQREALRWYQMAADLKDAIALINLGTIYEDGYEGVAPDRAKAFNCYEEASKLNNALAYFHLGLMYEAGRYVNKDLKQAVEMYKKSALMGCSQARDTLQNKKVPMIYDDGINTAQITLDETDGLISALDKQGLYGARETKPLISNPMITHMGKKTNQNILQSKIDKQGAKDTKSILMSNIGQFSNQQQTGSNYNQQGGTTSNYYG